MPEMRPPRPGEIEISLPQKTDAELYFIGRIRTPWPTRADCPKNTSKRRDVEATIEVDPPFDAGLKDLDRLSHVIVLYWLDQSRRDFIIQAPSHAPEPRGVFALRSPVRPNPIGHAVSEVVRVEGNVVTIRNIDCVDGTPLLDIKPYFASTDSVPEATRP
jgi:tRNA-Thr(GGU) m(6)t(6)A37 methyltransferase TsaA